MEGVGINGAVQTRGSGAKGGGSGANGGAGAKWSCRSKMGVREQTGGVRSKMRGSWPPPPRGPNLLGAQAEVAGHDAAVLEAARQVPHQVLVVQPIILIQVLLKAAGGCSGGGGGGGQHLRGVDFGGGSLLPLTGVKRGFVALHRLPEVRAAPLPAQSRGGPALGGGRGGCRVVVGVHLWGRGSRGVRWHPGGAQSWGGGGRTHHKVGVLAVRLRAAAPCVPVPGVCRGVGGI